MGTRFTPFLTQLSRTEGLDAAERRRLALLQYCNFLAVLNMAAFVLVYALVGGTAFWAPILASAACVPLYGLSWWLNRRGRFLGARLVFFSVLTGSIFLSTAFLFGRAPGLHFFFLLSALLPLLQWPLSRPFWILVFMTLSLAGFVFVQTRVETGGVLFLHFSPLWVPLFNGGSVVAVYAVSVAILALQQHRLEADSRALETKAEELSALLTQFESLSNLDPLTALNNRRAMLKRLEEERERMGRTQAEFAVLLGDIDRFKSINDEFGHEAGDLILVEVGRILKASLRDIDHVARWGGDEFLILLPGTSAEGAQVVAEKLRRQVEASTPAWRGLLLNCTMTFGIALHHGSQKDLLETIRQADAALYTGKGRGRNRVVLEPEPGLG